MASRGSDDEQPPQRAKWWCACIPWMSTNSPHQSNPVPDQDQEPRQQNPTAVQDTRREAPAHAGPAINDPAANPQSKGKEKVDEVAPPQKKALVGPSFSDAIPGGVYDPERKCSMCDNTTRIRHANDIILQKWSDVCNHQVCDECTADTLRLRNAGGPQIPDEEGVECPVEGCTQMLPAGQCRAFFRSVAPYRV